MDSVTYFELESGSRLKTIEANGLSHIGRSNPKRSTLVLPQSLTNVSPNWISGNTLFKEVIYCGTELLNGPISSEIEVKVTNRYPHKEIFDREAVKGSKDDEEMCNTIYDESMYYFFVESGNCEYMVANWSDGKNRCPKRWSIPDTYKNCSVTSIMHNSFKDCHETEGILRLPKNLKVIGGKAFANTKRVTGIVFPDGLEKIGESAFEKCGEDAEDAFEIVLPESVTAGSYAFKGAKVKSVRTLIK